MATEAGSKLAPALHDPLPLLEQLDPLVGATGSMKSGKEVARIISIMKTCQLLVSRCVLLNIIKSTKAQSTLAKFIEAGGWTVLNLWLAEAKKSQNIALLVELLQVLQKLPVTIAALKLGNMGKLIKQLSKQENTEVKTLAGELLAKWMSVFREGQASKVTVKPAGSEEQRRNSTSEEDSKGGGAGKAEGKKDSGKPPSKKKHRLAPPVEQRPPPGPLVALGKPKEKASKRPRDLLLQKSTQLPPDKKAKPSPSALAQDEKKGGAKAFVESEGFMNALSSQAARSKEKKVKKVKPVKPRSNSVAGENGPPEAGKESAPSISSPAVEEVEGSIEAPSASSSKKKRVSWADESNLVRFHFFDMDESERVNVNRSKSFLDAAQQEKMREREALEQGLMFSRDRLIEMIPWHRPPGIDLPSAEGFVRGAESDQRKVQLEREQKVLAQLFLSKSSLPSSASEPDPEPNIATSEPKLIPLMEPNAPGDPQVHPMPSQATPPGHLPPDSPLPPLQSGQPLGNYYHEGMPPPGAQNQGGPNFYPPPPPQQQGGFPPGGNGPPWNGPPPASQGEAGFYGSGGGEGDGGGEQFQYFRERGPPPPPHRGGRGQFPFRGGRGGRGTGPWAKRGLVESRMSRICKHFITHGCKLGSNCRFMHCTPEQLATQMASNDLPPSYPPHPEPHPPGFFGPPNEGSNSAGGHPSGGQAENSPHEDIKMDTSELPAGHT